MHLLPKMDLGGYPQLLQIAAWRWLLADHRHEHLAWVFRAAMDHQFLVQFAARIGIDRVFTEAGMPNVGRKHARVQIAVVSGAIPDQVAKARVPKRAVDVWHQRARILQLLQCFGRCGGMVWQWLLAKDLQIQQRVQTLGLQAHKNNQGQVSSLS